MHSGKNGRKNTGVDMTVREIFELNNRDIECSIQFQFEHHALSRCTTAIDTTLSMIDRFYDAGYLTSLDRGELQIELARMLHEIQEKWDRR